MLEIHYFVNDVSKVFAYVDSKQTFIHKLGFVTLLLAVKLEKLYGRICKK